MQSQLVFQEKKREGTTEKTEFAVVTGRETCVRAFF